MKKFIFYVKLGMFCVCQSSLNLFVGILLILSLFENFLPRILILSILLILPYFLIHLKFFDDVAIYYYSKEIKRLNKIYNDIVGDSHE